MGGGGREGVGKEKERGGGRERITVKVTDVWLY